MALEFEFITSQLGYFYKHYISALNQCAFIGFKGAGMIANIYSAVLIINSLHSLPPLLRALNQYFSLN